MDFPDLSDERVHDLYQASFEQSAAGMAVLLADTRVVMVNQRLCDMLGYTEEELLGLTFEALSYPEELDASLSVRSEMVGGARSSATVEKRYRRKDGSAMWARVAAGVVRDAEDQPLHFVATLIDIGEEKLAQQVVRDNQRWLEESQRAAGLGHYVYDIQKDWWDGSAMLYEVLGIDESYKRDFPGWLQTVDPLDRESMSRYFADEVLGKREPFDREYRVLRASDGAERWVYGLGTVEWSEAGQPISMFGVIQDITERKVAEEALRSSEVKFSTMFALAPDAMAIATTDGRVIDVNERFIELFGFSREEVLGHEMTELGVWADLADRQTIIDAVGRGAVVHGFEAPRRHKDGSPFLSLVSAGAVVVGGEKLIVSITQDITERKVAEEAIEQQAALIELAHDAIIVRDMESRVVTWNRGAESAYGWPCSEAVGKITHTLLHTTFPESREKVDEALLERGEWEGELEHSTCDGKRIVVASRQSLQRNPDGTAQSILEINRDITEHKVAEEALAESEDKFHYLFDHSIVASSLTRPAGEIDPNDAFLEMVGYTREELSDHATWQQISHPGDVAKTTAIVESILSGERDSARLDKRYLHKNGTVIWGDVSTSLRRDADGKPDYFMTTVLDVTARKDAEDEIRCLNAELEQRVLDRTAQLDASNKELEAFSYSVSHDLRAPLRHISGFSNLLMQRTDDSMDEKGRHYVETIAKSVSDMGVLIDDLLKFSRSGRTELQVADVDMEQVLAEALAPLRQETSDREIEWTIGPLPHVVGDQALLRQVWSNLLANAAKFSRTRSPARIEIGILSGDSDVAVSAPSEDVFYVRDNGAGFDMAYSDKLFGVFQRLHSASEYEGTGIGLANVQRILRRHGGRVWAEAELDHGATFYFALPRRMESPS